MLIENMIDFEEISLNEMDLKMACNTKLALMMDSGYQLFPNIYIGKEHIGGFDDLKFYFSDSEIKDKILSENGIYTSYSNTDQDENMKVTR